MRRALVIAASIITHEKVAALDRGELRDWQVDDQLISPWEVENTPAPTIEYDEWVLKQSPVDFDVDDCELAPLTSVHYQEV